MSGEGLPTGLHPARWLHNRHVEKRVSLAEKAAADLGVTFDAHSVRRALAFRWSPYFRRLRRVLIAFAVIVIAAAVTYRPACRPGGILYVSPTSCTSYSAYVLGPNAIPWASATFVATGITLTWVWSAWRGEHVASCYDPLYPLLGLLAASGKLVTMDGNRYTHAVKLNKKVARLSQPLWQLARDATSEFQSSRTVRRELREHVRRVTLAFTQAADGLMRDREVAARKLGSLAATAASNIAVDRFPEILPESLLPSTDPGESPLEPDRLDGRRLANACGWSLISDTTFSLFLAWLGGPAEVLVSLAVLGFPVAVYVILAAKYGLSEATRLTRSISSFFSSGSPL